MKIIYLFFLIASGLSLSAQINVTIDVNLDRKPISPFIYGRNNNFSSTNPNFTLAETDLTRLRDAGVTFFRENGGNNSTKYNWRRKLSSHPDWYNNVYTNNWDIAAKTLQLNFPNAQGMWAFGLLGKAAKTNAANFNDWEYNQSKWWEGVGQNLAGNGTLKPTGSKALVDGNIDLYLENWSADSTTGILDHWFGPNGIGLNKDKIQYWNMDNEPEIWNGTHDDVMPTQLSAEQFVQKYVEVALKARAKYPDIKLVGPVPANEWQWYNWNGGIMHNGRNYPWLEFFIKRIAEIQVTTGKKLLDVMDIHFYPGTNNPTEIVQLHRVFFDRNFAFPEANGVKNVSGNWDNSQNKEYIFGRINDWLAQYMGANHGVTLGITETGISGENASVTAVWYASTLGEFMKNKVELFSPWSWKNGMWETLHLMTKFNKKINVSGVSADENKVSAYPTVNNTNDSLTVVLVNRSTTTAQSVKVDLANFIASGTTAKLFTLKNLPSSETFISDSQNALESNTATILNNSITVSLAPLSVNSIVLAGQAGVFNAPLATEKEAEILIKVFPNPFNGKFTVEWKKEAFEKIEILGTNGQIFFTQNLKRSDTKVVINENLPSGNYIIVLTNPSKKITKKINSK